MTAELLESVDVLVPNRTELATLTGREPATSADEISAQLEMLQPSVGIVTLGAEGALVRAGGHSTHIPAPVVEAVDATAAGDAFCGALADAIATGSDPVAAATWAVQAGAITATRRGAQRALPTRSEVEALI